MITIGIIQYCIDLFQLYRNTNNKGKNADIYLDDKELLTPEAGLVYTIEFISSVFFFAGLIVVYNLRDIISNDNKTSFHNITAGLITLSLCSIVSVFEQQQLFTRVPFLNIPIFFQLLYWIGMITGLTMLLNGVSNWLPVYRKHLKYNINELNKSELFKQIEQLIRFENRNHVILLQALEMINKQYNFTESGCHLFSQQEKKMIFLGAADKENNTEIKSQKIHFYNSAIVDSIQNNNIKLVYITESFNSIPDLLLPMEVNNKLLGAFSFYAELPIDEQSVTSLKLIIDILSDKLYRDSKDIQNESNKRREEWLDNINDSIDNTKTLKENISRVKQLLQSEIGIDYLSISYIHQGKKHNLKISDNNQVLESLMDSYSEQNEIEQYVLNTNLPVVINNLDIETDFIVDLVALQNDMKSMAACPISNSHEQVGVIVVGSKKYQNFSKNSLQYVSILNNNLERLITNSQYKLLEKSESLRRSTLNKLLFDTTTNMSSAQLYKKVSDFIAKELNASMVRISLFGQDKRFLTSQVLSAAEKSPITTSEDATMMLSLMPNHQKVLQLRKTISVLADETATKESKMEQRQIFGNDLSHYMVTPLFNGRMIYGVITVGYTSDKCVVTPNDVLIVEDAAAILTIQNKINRQAIKIKNMQTQLQPKKVQKIKEHFQKQNIKSSRRITNLRQEELIGN